MKKKSERGKLNSVKGVRFVVKDKNGPGEYNIVSIDIHRL